MFQLPVMKRGTFQNLSYDERIATIDPEQRCLYLSRKKKPDDLCHHKMLVQEVALWPEHDARLAREDFHSREVVLTFQVWGVELKASEEDAEAAGRARIQTPPPPPSRATLSTAVTPKAEPHTDAASHEAHPENGGQEASVNAHGTPAPDDGEKSSDHTQESETNDPASTQPSGSVPKKGKRKDMVLRCTSVEVLSQFVHAFRAMQSADANAHSVQDDTAGAAGPEPHIKGDLAKVERQLENLDQEVRAQKKPPKGELIM